MAKNRKIFFNGCYPAFLALEMHCVTLTKTKTNSLSFAGDSHSYNTHELKIITVGVGTLKLFKHRKAWTWTNGIILSAYT